MSKITYGMQYRLIEGEQIIKCFKPDKKVFMLPVWIVAAILGLWAIIEGAVIVKVGMQRYIFILLLVFCVIVGVLYIIRLTLYKSLVYCVTDKRIIIRSGVISRNFRALPLESITTMDRTVGIVDKLCGEQTATIKFSNDSNMNLLLSQNAIKNQFTYIRDS